MATEVDVISVFDAPGTPSSEVTVDIKDRDCKEHAKILTCIKNAAEGARFVVVL